MNEGTAYEAEAEMSELARLADELVEEIGATRRHYDELRSALDGHGTEGDGEDAAVAVADPPADDARDAEDYDAPPSVEGARLVALNLALMGVGRDLAREKLCKGFDVEPEWVDQILDDAFGARDHNGDGNHDGDGFGNGAARRRFRRRRNGGS